MNPTPASASPDLAAAIKKQGAAHPLRLPLILVTVGCVVAGGGWFRWWRTQKAKHQVAAYSTEALARGDISLSITATGNLAPTTEVTVGSELSGTTLEVYVDFNDRVTKGTPLAKLDTSKLAEQTESSRAALNSAQAMVAQAEATVRESARARRRWRGSRSFIGAG